MPSRSQNQEFDRFFNLLGNEASLKVALIPKYCFWKNKHNVLEHNPLITKSCLPPTDGSYSVPILLLKPLDHP